MVSLMKVSTRTRYGIRAMLQLALQYGQGPLSVREIAEQQGLPEKYLEQLVASLKAGGLVRAVRGASGGYVLAQPPAELTLSDIFRVLEGSLAPVECVEEGEVCPQQAECATRDVWLQLAEAWLEVLEHTTLEDLAENSRQKGKARGKGKARTRAACGSAQSAQHLVRKV